MKRCLEWCCLTGIVLSAGCVEQPVSSETSQVDAPLISAPIEPAVAQNAVPAVTPAQPAAPITRSAEVLLSSRSKEQLIIAVDFAGTLATDKSRSPNERRQYVSDHLIRLYREEFSRKEKPGQKVKFFALGVPNRDDYLRGDFRNTDELAICETTHDALLDESRGDERLGSVEWRAALK